MAADDLDPHAGMPVPLDRVELDVAGEHGVVEVVVLHRERVHVAVEHLLSTAPTYTPRNTYQPATMVILVIFISPILRHDSSVV